MKIIVDLPQKTRIKIVIVIVVSVILFALIWGPRGGFANRGILKEALKYAESNCDPTNLNILGNKNDYKPECKNYKITANKFIEATEADKLNGIRKKLCVVVEHAERIDPKSEWTTRISDFMVVEKSDGSYDTAAGLFGTPLCSSLRFGIQ